MNKKFNKYPYRIARERLPAPAYYYSVEGFKLFGHDEIWRSAICPFHDDKKPSLQINLMTGGFVCMACDERGGDVLDFHMKRHGMPFMEAARHFGILESMR